MRALLELFAVKEFKNEIRQIAALSQSEKVSRIQKIMTIVTDIVTEISVQNQTANKPLFLQWCENVEHISAGIGNELHEVAQQYAQSFGATGRFMIGQATEEEVEIISDFFRQTL